MAELIDDSETFTIGLEGNGEPEPSKTPIVMMLGAAAVGLYLLLKR